MTGIAPGCGPEKPTALGPGGETGKATGPGSSGPPGRAVGGPPGGGPGGAPGTGAEIGPGGAPDWAAAAGEIGRHESAFTTATPVFNSTGFESPLAALGLHACFSRHDRIHCVKICQTSDRIRLRTASSISSKISARGYGLRGRGHSLPRHAQSSLIQKNFLHPRARARYRGNRTIQLTTNYPTSLSRDRRRTVESRQPRSIARTSRVSLVR